MITVSNKHFDPPQPVAGVRVTLSYFDGSEKITDARDRTNHEGKTELRVSEDALQRGDLRVEVDEAAGLVVYEPREGLLTAIPKTLEIALLPKGSPALLNPAQIEAMLDRLSRLSVRKQQLRAALAKAETPDFDVVLRDWADAKGFSYAEVDQKVHAWAEEVIAHREQESLERQAEAELGLRHYQKAAALFEALTNSTKSALDKGQDAYLAGRRAQLRDYLNQCSKAIKAFQYAYQFHRATELAEEGSKEAEAEHEHFPKDTALRSIWIDFALKTEEARRSEAESTVSQDREALLKVAATHLEELSEKVERDQERELWINVQFVLGGTFSALSNRVKDDAVRDELKRRAVTRYRAAIDASSREEDPRGWAAMQSILGEFLSGDAIDQIIAGSTTIPPAVDEAITAFQSALQVFTRTADPVWWSSLYRGISNMRFQKRILTEKGHRKEIGAEFVAAQREALAALDREQYPLEWALSHETLANALMFEGLHSSPQESAALFSEAIDALRAGLKIFTRNEEPQAWLNSTNVLSEVLELYARRVSADESVKSLTEAIALRRAELEVLNKDAYPRRWAEFQKSLGKLLFEAAQRNNSAEQMDRLLESASHLRDAAEELKNCGDLRSSSDASTTLGRVLTVLALRSSADERQKRLSDAAKAFEAAIDAYPKNVEAVSALSNLYHDFLFDFPKAYELAKRSVELRPSTARKLDLAEASFTTRRFDECLSVLNSIDQPRLGDSGRPVWRVLLLACQAGAHHAESAQTASTFSEFDGKLETSGFSADGDLRFLSAAPEFSSSLGSWSKLFKSLADADGVALAEAGRDLTRVLEH